MFGKKKESRQGSSATKRDLSQFGIFDVPQDIGLMGGGESSDGGDSDFEAELAAISGGNVKPNKKRPKAAPPQASSVDLDRMVAASLADVDTDVDSDDERDPTLLRELNAIAGDIDEEEGDLTAVPEQQTFAPTSAVDVVALIKTRIGMYESAEAIAKSTGDAGKVRRLQRGLKTLQGLLKQASAGKVVALDDIPPEVSVKRVGSGEDKPAEVASPMPPSVPARVAPPPPPAVPERRAEETVPPSPKSRALDALSVRKDEYKLAAVTYKKNGDKESALKLVKILKMIDMALAAVAAGEAIDLSEMPPKPEEYLEMERNSALSSSTPDSQSEPVVAPPPPEATNELISANTIEEALNQRLEKYRSVETAAKAEGNTSKARRFGRIIKQYEDAIKAYRLGKTVNYDELPTPPGFGPLPQSSTSTAASTIPKAAPEVSPAGTSPESNDAAAEASPKPKPPLPAAPLANRVSGNLANTTLMQKQIQELQRRQSEFKQAAIEAKKSGDIEEAKEYLRSYKGFDKLLETAKGGFPVDMTTLPIPPNKRAGLEDSFEVIAADGISTEDGGEGEVIDRLLQQLKGQLTMCKATRDHHRAMGDVAGTNKFENLALSVQKDIDVMKLVKRNKKEMPKYHYERKTFNVVKCNTDLTDNQMELSIERGINYGVSNPKEVDTYVKFEFPYPQETLTKGRTPVAKNTDNPEYKFQQLIDIQRTSRQCVRLFKRHSLKLEVYSDRGFLRADQLIGTVNVKLQPLESECEIHESFDLMNGRKAVGGKLEVRLRVRNPLLNKQIEKIDEKWLVIDT